MILSHKHRFIFIKTHKTASSSIELFLNQQCSKNDIVTPLVREQQEGQNYRSLYNIISLLTEARIYGAKLAYKRFISRNKFFDHMPAQLVKSRVSQKIWNSYYKFCFERNPWDKMVSYYYWKCRNRKISFDDFLKEEDYCTNFQLYTKKKRVILDHVGRYENLEDELESICRATGIKFERPFNIRAKSGIRKTKSYRSYYDNTQREIIEEVFSDEIKMHSYRF